MQSEALLAVATGRSGGALKLILPQELLVYNVFVSELEVSPLLEFKPSLAEVDAMLSSSARSYQVDSLSCRRERN